MSGLGDAIATLDSLDMVALAAATVPTREATLVSKPAPSLEPDPAFLFEGESEEFMRYMNEHPDVPAQSYQGALYSGGSSYAPGLPIRGSSAGLAGATRPVGRAPMPRQQQRGYINPGQYAGGSSYYPGAPLLTTNAGLAGDIAALDRSANIISNVQRRAPREASFGGDHYGENVMGGSSWFPGAALGPTSWGLSGLEAMPPSIPATQRQAHQPLTDREMQPRFLAKDAFAEYLKLGGDAELRKLLRAQKTAAQQRSPRQGEIQRRIAIVRLFRTKLAAPDHAKWATADVQKAFLISMRDANTTAQLKGVGGLAGLNAGLEGLEGALGRKIRKKLKQGVKVAGKAAGKLTKSAIKMGIRVGSGGIIPI